MTEAVMYIFLYIAIIVFEIRPMIKKKNKKALYIYLPVVVLTLTINILYGLGIYIPSPVKPVKDLVTQVLRLK
jgi:type III secretory pathway component EscR